MKYYKGFLLAVLASTVTAKCGPGYGKCPNGQCCSKYGYCGSTSDYCDGGCQSGYGICNTSSNISSNGRCGTGYGTKCPNNECCSKYSYCGTSSAHCDAGCQSSFGRCNSSTSTTPSSSKISTNGRCGTDYGTKCPSGQCCSKYGYCGTSSAHCDAGCQSSFGSCGKVSSTSTTSSPTTVSTNGRCGASFGTKCPNNECCSKYGYCGTSSAHCDTGCQSSFGSCGSTGGNNSKTNTNTKFQFYKKCNNPKHWALTFDDGPYQYDLDLLDLLKKKGVKATFFLNGSNNMEIETSLSKQIVQRMYKEGHVIGSHTWSHADLNTIDTNSIKNEMVKLENVLKNYIGKKPAFMRPPYGHASEEKVSSILSSLGYTAACMWNVDTKDWDNKGDINYARTQLGKSLGNSIISLNHSAYVGITKDKLIKLIDAEIDYMISNGYTPVTMDVCLGLKAYQN